MAGLQVQIAPAARQDMRDLLDWGVVEFGEIQAVKYSGQLVALFESIGRFPHIGMRLAVEPGNIRTIVHESHRVIYEVRHDHVRILRIVHVRANLPATEDRDQF